jgi:hypothetical protein
MHDMDVLHGDLHTKNILVDRNKDKAIASEKYKDVGRLIQILEKRVPGSLLRECAWWQAQIWAATSLTLQISLFM